MKILYITFIDFTISNSGSSVRPHKMYDAFLENGNEVILVRGDDFISHDNSEHLRSVKSANEWLDDNKPDICYIENTTHPLYLIQDRKLIKRIHDMGVPVGYFYRDAYYRFPRLYLKNKSLKNAIIYNINRFLHLRDECFVRKYVDVLYFPSPGACDLFPHPDKRPLPPAGEIFTLNTGGLNRGRSLYVGGIAARYGFGDMIQAFSELNTMGNYPLTVICRQFELQQWGKTAAEYMSEYPWLTIAHASGKELEKHYHETDVCIVPQQDDAYNDMAVSVKLYEYLSYGKPFIARPGTALKQIFEDCEAAIIVNNFTIDALKEGIRNFFSDKAKLQEMQKAAAEYIRKGNTWEDRAKTVCDHLTKKQIEIDNRSQYKKKF